MKVTDVESIYPTGRRQWRKWLEKNHDKKDAIWVICYKKQAEKPTIAWSDAVDEALCFGWIDSQRNSLDDEKFIQRFSRRKPVSTWSKVNKEKIKRLTQEGLMSAAGLKAIEVAKQNGSWTLLDEVEELIIPKDLENALKRSAVQKAIL
jgi:uncharacterized protein YdeI (YjbR/CyaY-like superfamily)